MQFLLIAYDGTDPATPERRMKVRERIKIKPFRLAKIE
jgi:hypothetical protein